MEASSAGKCEYGGKRRRVKYWACLGCWISPSYGPSSLGMRFETYEPFISLIFQFFLGRSKLRMNETVDTESVNMGAQMYMLCVKNI
jgi:hypothetical protein